MKKIKQNLDESINKVKFLINYDSSKTLTEQGVLGGNVPSDTPRYESLPQKQETLTGRGSSYRARNPMDKLINYYEIYRDEFAKTERGVNDNIINDRAKKLYNDMRGLSMNHKMIPAVFQDMRTPSDVIALIDKFNSTYGQKQDLKRWLSNEITSANVQLKTAEALKNISRTYKETKTPTVFDITKTDPIRAPEEKPKQDINKQGYKFVAGTKDEPYKYGTLGSGIAQLQQNLGLVQDGKWGSKTQAKIKELAPQYINGFTNDDLLKVIQAVRTKRTPENATPKAPTAQLNPISVSTKNVKPKLAEQVKPGEMFGKTAKGAGMAAGAGWLAAPAIAGYTGVAGAGLKGSLIASAAATAGAATAGIAALGLIPLVLWLNDKDKVRPKVEKLFKIVSEHKKEIEIIPRGLGEQEIWDASDKLFNAMSRLGTREKDVYEVFNSLQTISDLSELITFYEQDNGISLLKQLDKDFDMTREWMMIYKPIQRIVFKFIERMKAESEILQQQNQQITVGNDTIVNGGQTTVTSGYRMAKGTIDDPYVRGTSGDGIFKIQKCLGLIQDGKFGPKTQAALSGVGEHYSRGFTSNDVSKICGSINKINRSEIQNIKLPSVAQPVNRLQLAPMAPNNPTKADARDQYKK